MKLSDQPKLPPLIDLLKGLLELARLFVFFQILLISDVDKGVDG
jgi:hypothetical protein